MDSAPKNGFFYLSAQNKGSSGSITVEILDMCSLPLSFPIPSRVSFV